MPSPFRFRDQKPQKVEAGGSLIVTTRATWSFTKLADSSCLGKDAGEVHDLVAVELVFSSGKRATVGFDDAENARLEGA
jgi:hypothetical protein